MMAPAAADAAPRDGSLLSDLRGLLQRLRRVQERGGSYRRVQLSPQLCEALKSFRVVGNEMLVLAPEREGV